MLGSLALAACSGNPPPPRPLADHAVGSAATPPPVALPTAQPTGPYRALPGDFAKGDVQLRVEWHDVPLAARASPGRTACGTAAAPAVEPTTTWGIPDALVAIDVDHGKPIGDAAARVVLAECALSPRVIVTGPDLVIASATDAPAQLQLARAGSTRTLEPAADRAAIAVDLPIAGHAVHAALAADALYELTGSDVEPAWIAETTRPYVAVTEASGQVVLRDVPVGTYPVRALVPPRAGQPALTGSATVTVTAGALAEVTVAVH